MTFSEEDRNALLGVLTYDPQKKENGGFSHPLEVIQKLLEWHDKNIYKEAH